MSETTIGIIFIAGKAAIWLLIPLAIGIWELRRHRKMMAEAPERPAGLPNWLQKTAPAQRRPATTAPTAQRDAA